MSRQGSGVSCDGRGGAQVSERRKLMYFSVAMRVVQQDVGRARAPGKAVSWGADERDDGAQMRDDGAQMRETMGAQMREHES